MYIFLNLGICFWITTQIRTQLFYCTVKNKENAITGGMKTISMNKRIAMIKTDAMTSLSQVSAEDVEAQVRHSASLPAHTKKTV